MRRCGLSLLYYSVCIIITGVVTCHFLLDLSESLINSL